MGSNRTNICDVELVGEIRVILVVELVMVPSLKEFEGKDGFLLPSGDTFS